MKTIIAYISKKEDSDEIVNAFEKLGYLLHYKIDVKPNEEFTLSLCSPANVLEHHNIKIPNVSSINKMIIALGAQDPGQPEIIRHPKLELGNKAALWNYELEDINI